MPRAISVTFGCPWSRKIDIKAGLPPRILKQLRVMSDDMILAKIPFTLLSTLALYISFTPPNQAKQDERLPENSTFADSILRFSEHLRKAVPNVYLAVGVLEIATIVLQELDLLDAAHTSGSCATDLSPSPLLLFGAILIIAGGFLRYLCDRTLKKLFTFDLTIQKDHTLVTSGPYQFVRHPSYTALLMVYIGIFCYFLSPGSWLRECGGLNTVVGAVFYGSFITIRVATFWALLKRMAKEDAALKKQFGKEWDQWADSVPYRLIPGIY